MGGGGGGITGGLKMTKTNEQQEPKQPIVIHLAQVKRNLSVQERKALATKIAEALLQSK